MTRKRFKKLLMSRGYQRDDAEQIACKACESGLSYADYWKRYLFVFGVNKGIVGFNKACKKLGTNIRQLAESFSKIEYDTNPLVAIFHSMNKIR